MSQPGLPTHGPHVFVSEIGSAGSVTIDGPAGHHLARVLRVRSGDPVSLADGSGTVWQARVVGLHREAVELDVADAHQVPPQDPRLVVVQSLPKGRKMDEVVQRLTEVGVDGLIPVVTARTVKQPGGKDDKLLERWRAIELAAAQQSRRARRMEVEPIRSWPPAGSVGVVLWEEAETPLERALDGLLRSDELVLAIGPEGGFTHAEVASSGLRPARLGRTILRTETAGIVAAVLAGATLGRYV